jgi:hypothetical protein
MEELVRSETSTRRGLLRALARTAAQRTRETANIIGPGTLHELLTGGEPPMEGSTAAVAQISPSMPARSRARAPLRAVSLGELLSLAHEEGLTERDGALRALASHSLRMTATEAAHADAWIQTSDASTAEGDEVLQALIHLAVTSGHDCELPNEAWLAVFVARGDPSSGSAARRARGVVLDMPPAIPDAAEPVVLVPELVMPRRWHYGVQRLDLDETEREAYDRLRTRVQDIQGVENDMDGGPLIAYHRLLGYPNETTGTMPEDCMRAWQQWLAIEGLESSLIDAEAAWREWQLLAQVSVGERRRTYVWIRQTDLEAREFEKLCAFVR